MKRIIFDIETGPLPDEQLERVMPEFSAPANFKDPAKIDAAIAEKREAWKADAALSAITGQISEYATYEAWLREFTKFQAGLGFFSHRAETRPPLPGPGDPLVE